MIFHKKKGSVLNPERHWAPLGLIDGIHSSRPPPFLKGGGWKILAQKQKGGGWKKILKRGGSIQKGVPLLKGGGAGKVKVRFS